MYIYYEHHHDATGKVVLTELRLSSHSNGVLEIAFYKPTEKMVFEAVKPLLKWPPLSCYSYEPSLKIWSYFGQYGVTSTYGEEVIKKVQTVVEALAQPFKAISVDDLAGQAVNDFVDVSVKSKFKSKLKAEEFFYNHGVPAAQPAMTREVIEIKLWALFECGVKPLNAAEMKKLYRQAALRLHPDRNNGNSKAMSELNMLWQAWQKETTNA